MKNNIQKLLYKFTSRKFWMAVAGLISGVIMTFGGTAETGQNAYGVVLSVASILAYIVGEGVVDVTYKNSEEQSQNGQNNA